MEQAQRRVRKEAIIVILNFMSVFIYFRLFFLLEIKIKIILFLQFGQQFICKLLNMIVIGSFLLDV